MATPPFTPTGLQDKLDELYVLPDPALSIEADAIQNDLRNWVKSNFALTMQQESYLYALPEEFVTLTAFDTGTAVRYRLPITLEEVGTVSASKLIRTQPQLEYTNHPVNGFSVSGSVGITMEYF